MQRRQLLYFIIDFDQISWIYFDVTCQVMKLSDVLLVDKFPFSIPILTLLQFMWLNSNLSIELLFKRVDIFQPL